MINESDYLETLIKKWKEKHPAFLPMSEQYPYGRIPITEYLRKWAEAMPESTSIVYYGKEITFRELDQYSNKFANYLLNRGLKKGDRVAVYMPNCPQFYICFFGILKIGCIHVPINPMFKEYELEYELNDTGVEFLVTLDYLYPLIEKVKEKTKVKEVMISSFKDFLPEEPTLPVHITMKIPKKSYPGAIDLVSVLEQQEDDHPHTKVLLSDAASINYTGGTTGLPKGCIHTHENMLYRTACWKTYYLPNTSLDDVVLVYNPIFWIAGQMLGILCPIFAGMKLVLFTRWDPVAIMEAIQKYKVSILYGIVDNIAELIEHPKRDRYDLSSLKITVVSSFIKVLNEDLRQKWSNIAPSSSIIEGGYGLTETHAGCTFTTGMQENDMDLKSRPVFCGFPMPGTLLKIVDFETKNILPLGSEGEIVIKTPSLFKGYWNRPEENQKLSTEGWLFTGDIGQIDEDGFLHFLGRRKDMIKVSGMSVFPTEIESILNLHPAVEVCAVIGVPHPEKGEIPLAFIKINERYKNKISETDIISWCKEKISSYKIPVITIREDLPVTATGKVMKEELRKLVNYSALKDGACR